MRMSPLESDENCQISEALWGKYWDFQYVFKKWRRLVWSAYIQGLSDNDECSRLDWSFRLPKAKYLPFTVVELQFCFCPYKSNCSSRMAQLLFMMGLWGRRPKVQGSKKQNDYVAVSGSYFKPFSFLDQRVSFFVSAYIWCSFHVYYSKQFSLSLCLAETLLIESHGHVSI